MSTPALIMMVIILTVVWGGFVFAVITAIKKEKSKTGDKNDL